MGSGTVISERLIEFDCDVDMRSSFENGAMRCLVALDGGNGVLNTRGYGEG